MANANKQWKAQTRMNLRLQTQTLTERNESLTLEIAAMAALVPRAAPKAGTPSSYTHISNLLIKNNYNQFILSLIIYYERCLFIDFLFKFDSIAI